MGIVDYLLQDPYNDPWPESKLDNKIVVAIINSFHKALDCMDSRLEITGWLNRNENLLDKFRRNVAKQSWLSGWYGNENVQKRAKLDRSQKKSTFATVETAKQQLKKKTDNFFFISTQQTVVSRYCKNSPKFSETISEKKTDHRRRWQKNSTDRTTGGRIHHSNGGTKTVKRAF